jgi:hypothetical protein
VRERAKESKNGREQKREKGRERGIIFWNRKKSLAMRFFPTSISLHFAIKILLFFHDVVFGSTKMWIIIIALLGNNSPSPSFHFIVIPLSLFFFFFSPISIYSSLSLSFPPLFIFSPPRQVRSVGVTRRIIFPCTLLTNIDMYLCMYLDMFRTYLRMFCSIYVLLQGVMWYVL